MINEEDSLGIFGYIILMVLFTISVMMIIHLSANSDLKNKLIKGEDIFCRKSLFDVQSTKIEIKNARITDNYVSYNGVIYNIDYDCRSKY